MDLITAYGISPTQLAEAFPNLYGMLVQSRNSLNNPSLEERINVESLYREAVENQVRSSEMCAKCEV